MHSPARRRPRRLAATALTVALVAGFTAIAADTASASPASHVSSSQTVTPSVHLASAKKAKVPNLVGKSGKTAEKLLKKVHLKWKWKAPKDEFVILASNWKVTAQATKPGTSVKVGKKIKLTVVKKETTSSSSSSTSGLSSTPTFAPQTFTGTGDSVENVNLTKAGIISFSCPSCSDNTTLESNGPDSLIVNEIGAYTGSNFINTSSGALTTKLTIGANAPWSLTIADLASAKTFTGAATGSGDQVIRMTGTFSDVALRNTGSDNFVVQSYDNGDFDPLVANEIGAYAGTVPMTGPSYVSVESSGPWSITPAD